jgi:ABC-2 type transport system permease protein
LFGFFFVTVISHDTLSREIDSQTIRFLVTKTTRSSIVLGKYLGVYSFWTMVVTASYIPIIFVSGSFNLLDYIQLLSFLCFVVGLTILFSAVIKSPTYTLLCGIFCSFVFPVVGVMAMVKTGLYWNLIKFLTPYYYYVNTGYWILVPFLMSILMVLISIIIFTRRDL